MRKNNQHITFEELLALHGGRLDLQKTNQCRNHLDVCEDCQNTYEAIQEFNTIELRRPHMQYVEKELDEKLLHITKKHIKTSQKNNSVKNLKCHFYKNGWRYLAAVAASLFFVAFTEFTAPIIDKITNEQIESSENSNGDNSWVEIIQPTERNYDPHIQTGIEGLNYKGKNLEFHLMGAKDITKKEIVQTTKSEQTSNTVFNSVTKLDDDNSKSTQTKEDKSKAQKEVVNIIEPIGQAQEKRGKHSRKPENKARSITNIFDENIPQIEIEKISKRVKKGARSERFVTKGSITDAGTPLTGFSVLNKSTLNSPVTTETLNPSAIRQSASIDYYDELTRLKGVHNTQTSVTFNSINARGFSKNGNVRFLQLQDGMDNAAPLLNFPTGNIVGISELDIKDVTLIPGASSAIYGPNALNGTLLMESKDPFQYQGLSVQLKTGLTEGSASTDPLYGLGIRYAEAVSDKLAFKINFSSLFAKDWEVKDYDNQRFSGDPISEDSRFDRLNTYGDETEFLIPILDSIKLRRTGWQEMDLLRDDRDAESLNGDVAVHYRITDNLEANLSYKFGTGSTIYQGSERYALRDFTQQFAKVELNSDKWNIRAYRSMTNGGNSYNMTALASLVNEALFPTAGWAAAYSAAYEGNFSQFGISGDDHKAARDFADAGGIGSLEQDDINALTGVLGSATVAAMTGQPYKDGTISDTAMAIVGSIRTLPFQDDGARLIDDSNMNHIEGNYDFSHLVNDVVNLKAGANWRRYNLFTGGTVLNEDPDGDGFNERIKIGEYGAYLQTSKSLANDKLKFTSSIRYDKNQNFKEQFSPRISAVYSIYGNNGSMHNIRASYQTGFRNPTSEEQYIYFQTMNHIILGGTEDNAGAYGIFGGSALSEGGDTINLGYVQPEKLQTLEIGYKGRSFINQNKLLFDANFYYGIYKDFIQLNNVTSINTAYHQGNEILPGTTFRPYFNAPVNVNAFGFTTSLEYTFMDNWKLSGNYSYNNYSLNEDDLTDGFKDFEPGFNTPKHKINFGLFNRELIDNLSFGVHFKWQDEFDWFSSFGEGVVPAYYTIDTQISYRIPKAKTTIKFGVSNLTKNEYITNYGAATIGRMPHLTITYDEF